VQGEEDQRRPGGYDDGRADETARQDRADGDR
jgi:hypothetical protein